VDKSAFLDAKKPIDRVQSQAEVIVYSMFNDGPEMVSGSTNGTSGFATPITRTSTPMPSAISRLQKDGIHASQSSASLAAAGKKSELNKRFLGGSKSLDHLSMLLTSCETVSMFCYDLIR